MTTHAESILIQIYSVDWTDGYDTHNSEHRTEPRLLAHLLAY